MTTVAVLGGGPAGSTAAETLAAAGIKTILFDEKLAWEKPCGGGITYKAYTEYPFLIDNEVPKKLVTTAVLSASGKHMANRSATLSLSKPIVIYSRYDLNNMLLERAAKAGVEIEKTRVVSMDRTRNGWCLQTLAGKRTADFCIVATGARNALKQVGTKWSAADTMMALGYYIPAERPHIDIQFFENFEGYVWIFPRHGHLSAGICGKAHSSRDLRTRLERYLSERAISLQGASFYGHVLPSLEKQSWSRNRVEGDGWMAVGDAAGLVDPVTGEGLYYSVRSADLATRALLKQLAGGSAALGAEYREALQKDCVEDLELASRLGKRLFLGKFLYRNVPYRMVDFMCQSPTFSAVVQDLFSGTQSYLDLKSRLKRSWRGTFKEVLMNAYLRRLVPSS